MGTSLSWKETHTLKVEFKEEMGGKRVFFLNSTLENTSLSVKKYIYIFTTTDELVILQHNNIKHKVNRIVLKVNFRKKLEFK